MDFSVRTENHMNAAYCADMATLIRQLIAASGNAVVEGEAEQQIWIECFRKGDPARFEKLAADGVKLIIVATEFLTGRTFNDFGQPPFGHYGHNPYWRLRFETFLQCARHASAVWCVPDQAEQLAAYRSFVHCPVLPLPVPCFSPGAIPEAESEKTCDLFFWGQLTPHRQEVLGRLAKKHATIFGGYFPEADRAIQMARSKVSLNVRQCPEWKFPSALRYWIHLSAGSYLIGERCEHRCALDEYVDTADDLAEACAEALASGDFGKRGREAHERFAADCPPGPMAEELIDLTFSRSAAA